jgi:cell shape-determining protein MreC
MEQSLEELKRENKELRDTLLAKERDLQRLAELCNYAMKKYTLFFDEMRVFYRDTQNQMESKPIEAKQL